MPVYNPYKNNMLGDGVRVDLDDDTIVSRLVADEDYTFDPTDTDGSVAAIPPYGGEADQTLTSPDISNERFDADDSVFPLVAPANSKDIDGIVILKDLGAGNFFPLWYYDLAAAVTPNGTNITVQWNAAGLLTVSG